MNWIDIKEERPTEGEIVLGFRPFAHTWGDKEYTVLKYEGFLNVDHLGNTHGFERNHFVSHWCRLEKPNK